MKTVFHDAKIIGAGIDPATYHLTVGKRGERNFVMTRSNLCDFLTCPARWIAGHETADTKATEWGQLMDALVLDSDRFNERVAITPATYPDSKTGEPKDWNRNANFCKAWEKERSGLLIVKPEKFGMAQDAKHALLEDEISYELISGSRHQVLVTATHHDPESGLDIPVKTLIDLVPAADLPVIGESLADLKTADFAGPSIWPKKTFEYNYHVQAALSLDLFNAASGEERTTFLHLIQESSAPYAVGRRMLSQDFVELGRATYRTALAFYARCLKRSHWPGYDDMTRVCIDGYTLTEPAPWMAMVTAEPGFGRAFEKQPVAEKENDVPIP
jgi:hypothetical protein